ncbi:hypothetical protein ACTHQF_16105 [Pedobacter sp. SAFR-022]|uniref:hypothetical protein n=1 Tax=Pedobacter sp. SAFR-022 TaxID=3436861 RepID=UPI003F7F40DA
MKKDNEIDQLFKRGMDDPDIPFNALDWEKMAEKLAAREASKRRLLWIYAGAGIAAALLLVMFLFLSDQTAPIDPAKDFNAKAKPGRTDRNSAPLGPMKPSDEKNKLGTLPPQTYAKNARRTARPANPQLNRPKIAASEKEIPMLYGVSQPQIRSNIELREKNKDLLIGLELVQQSGQIVAAGQKADRRVVGVENFGPRPGKITLSLLAAPDVTDSRTSIGTKISANFGLLVTYPISKKLSVSSGAIYARKLYDYGGTLSSAYGESARPWALNADCFVIDVPVNVNYQLLRKKNYSVSVNSGLSSYFMLKEKYKYRNTGPDGVEQTTALEINNQNQHIFGVANLSISVDRKVSDKVSIGVQPFLKLPLTGIGYYDYNLRSRGIAVSLSVKPFGTKK